MRKVFLTALALLALVCRTTNADTIQAHLQTVVDNGNGTFTYNYQLVLTNGNGIANSTDDPGGDGNFPAFESGLIILDFYGLVGAPVLSSSGTDITVVADWNTATPLTGGSPLDSSSYSAIPILGNNTFLQGTNPTSIVGGPDHPGVPNVVLQYEGPDEPVDLVSPRNLIHLALTSTIGTSAPERILTLSRDTGPNDDNRPVETYSIAGPVVPLPAIAWAGFALFGGLGLKRRRGQAVAA